MAEKPHKDLMDQSLLGISIENRPNLSYCLNISFRANNHEKIIPKNNRYNKKQSNKNGGATAPIL
ncbi:hypothetical protein LDG_9025 [Legionella drancourtii LLAP12]|uniref:Uncharacterized protein n=1 Tax=Legionella drancourtii LLAP12 TaxID=658187 RepID=G9EUM7_9GAMM|nr:hypothetical protein LDG_9025 [Legionella drancourtii LLAP12]